MERDRGMSAVHKNNFGSVECVKTSCKSIHVPLFVILSANIMEDISGLPYGP